MTKCESCSTACEFAKYMAIVDEAKTDMELPCEDAEYQEYLNGKKADNNEVLMEKAS